MIKDPLKHLQYESKVTGFFFVQIEICVKNGKYIESDDCRRNKDNEKNF